MAPNVSAVALGADVPVALSVIIGVEALTVDSTAAAAIGRTPSFRSSSLSKPRRLSSRTTASLGGEGGVDVDQAREASRVGERRD